VAMASEHKMVTTAEGVETEEQRIALRNLQCAEMQGFLFSPARSSGDIRTLLDGTTIEGLGGVSCA
jgi:EAL domain-containing protein (putative c-di-GMP-specific phosphodiesterase class I)